MKNALMIALLGISPAAVASSPGYDYIEAGYFQGELEDELFGSLDFDGWGVQGSTSLSDWLLTGSYLSLSTDPITVELPGMPLRADVAGDQLLLGGGRIFRMQDTAAFTLTAGYARQSADVDVTNLATGDRVSDDSSDSGWFVGASMRAAITAALEGEVSAERIDAEDVVTNWRASVRYHFTPAFALAADWRSLDGDDAIGVSGRFVF